MCFNLFALIYIQTYITDRLLCTHLYIISIEILYTIVYNIITVKQEGGKEAPMKLKSFQRLTKQQQREYFDAYKKEWLATHNS